MAGAASPNVDIKLGGIEVADSHFLSYTVQRDMFQPDMATIVLANQNDLYSCELADKIKIGASVEINVGKDATNIYKGEIVSIEPSYKGGQKSSIVFRAMNRFHRLLRKRRSITFTEKNDQQILQQVVSGTGLSLEWKHEKTITYKHVYQHNQTDMEFLRTRAARMGCHVWCVDQTLYVKQPELQGSEIAALDVDQSAEDGALRSFTPRLNSTNIINKVTVKGWNPETKELIVGEATVQGSQLGSQTSVAGSGDHGNEESFTVDHPIWDKAEATALAKARLQAASLTYITGEAETQGSPKFDLGKLVKITANARGGSDAFNGKYYIMGLTHRHNASHAKDDSAYVTILRLARDAQRQ